MSKKYLLFHGFGSTPDSYLNNKIVESLDLSFENDIVAPILPGHTGVRENPINPSYVVENGIYGMINEGYKIIQDFVSFNENNDMGFIGNSVGAYIFMNWLESNQKNKFKNIVLFKPMFDLEHSLNNQDEAFKEVGISSLKNFLQFDSYSKKFNNNIKGTIDNPYKNLNEMIIFSGENDSTVGNVQFMKDRLINSNVKYVNIPNTAHFSATDLEMKLFKKEVINYLKLNTHFY